MPRKPPKPQASTPCSPALQSLQVHRAGPIMACLGRSDCKKGRDVCSLFRRLRLPLHKAFLCCKPLVKLRAPQLGTSRPFESADEACSACAEVLGMVTLLDTAAACCAVPSAQLPWLPAQLMHLWDLKACGAVQAQPPVPKT